MKDIPVDTYMADCGLTEYKAVMPNGIAHFIMAFIPVPRAHSLFTKSKQYHLARICFFYFYLFIYLFIYSFIAFMNG